MADVSAEFGFLVPGNIIMFPLSVSAGVAKLSAEDLVRALGSSFACLALTKSQE